MGINWMALMPDSISAEWITSTDQLYENLVVFSHRFVGDGVDLKSRMYDGAVPNGLFRIFSIGYLAGNIANGGLEQYFSNALAVGQDGFLICKAIEAAKVMGIVEVTKILTEAIVAYKEFLPSAVVAAAGLEGHDARAAISFDDIPETVVDRLEELDLEFDSLRRSWISKIEVYVRSHTAAFVYEPPEK